MILFMLKPCSSQSGSREINTKTYNIANILNVSVSVGTTIFFMDDFTMHNILRCIVCIKGEMYYGIVHSS